MEQQAKLFLNVLLIEDSEDDAFFINDALRRGGYELFCKRVQTAAEMRQALTSQTWDLVLSDHRVPGFSGMEAFEIYRTSGLRIPFIMLSGSIDEEMAVSVRKTGVHDYVSKDHLDQLAAAVRRHLRAAGKTESKGYSR